MSFFDHNLIGFFFHFLCARQGDMQKGHQQNSLLQFCFLVCEALEDIACKQSAILTRSIRIASRLVG
jgi:hypothetical protein